MGCCESHDTIKSEQRTESNTAGDKTKPHHKYIDSGQFQPSLRNDQQGTLGQGQSGDGKTNNSETPDQQLNGLSGGHQHSNSQNAHSPPQLNSQGQHELEIKLKASMFVRSSSQALLDQYSIGRVLGEGGFGTVCLVTHKTTQMVRAMKMISKKKLTKSDEERMFAELEILREMDHPNIVKVFEHYQDEKYHYLISEYCQGGELFERIKEVSPFTEKVAASYMKQILGAIQHCHIKRICHRDLKPENILFDNKLANSNLKVIDFGASTRFDPNAKLTKRIGTPFYVAPEILNKQPYDEKCDVWSLGVIMYIMLCGYPPFWGQTDQEIYEKVKRGKFEFYNEDWDHISDDAKDLIRKMLAFDPNERITTAEAFAHPWIAHNVHVEPLDDKIMKKLVTFTARNKIGIAFMQLIATQVLSTKEKEALTRNFQAMDKNGDGMLSKEELVEGYTVILNDPLKANEIVERVFSDIDTDGSGKVDFREFLVASADKEKLLSRDKIEKSFKLIDEDGNGQITRKELEDIMGGLPMDDKAWAQLLKECDQNGDGMISLTEFLDLLLKSVEVLAK